MCEHPLQFPFSAEVFDFGERFGETDGDRVLSVIAESGSAEKPAAEDVASALAPTFDLTSEVEEAAHEAEWFMNFESRDNGCRFSVRLSTDSLDLEVRDFERTWMLAFVERSPENQAFLAD